MAMRTGGLCLLLQCSHVGKVFQLRTAVKVEGRKTLNDYLIKIRALIYVSLPRTAAAPRVSL